MKTVIKFLCVILSCIIAFSLTGCSDTKDAYIYFELTETPKTLDPQVASINSELLIIKNIHEGLMRENDKGEIICGIAESYKKDGLTYSFKLRKDAKWSNGEKITPKDFEFAFLRALSPETNAPFASRLMCIKGASEYNSGATNNLLGISANNDTVTITLNYDDEHFLKTLTTAICMPCNQSFFEESKGKYGLFADNIISSGSYKLTRWRKDPFGIRLYDNDDYNGFAVAKNSAVFISCNKDEPIIDKINGDKIDMAFIDAALTDKAHSLNIETKEFNNICWFLSLGKDFSEKMRKSFALLTGNEIFSSSLPVGYTAASSVYPKILTNEPILSGYTTYNLEAGKNLYLNELSKLPDKKFPTDVVLYYYDDGYVKNVVTDIVGHWQSNLSTFINIEAVSSPELLTSQLTDQTYRMAFFPIRADSKNIKEYLKNFELQYDGGSLDTVQAQLLTGNKIIPVMTQNTVIAYSKELSNVVAENGNGYIDFSYIIKDKDK